LFIDYKKTISVIKNKKMIKRIKVRDVMKTEIKVIEREETLWDAAIQMSEYNIGSLIVNPKEKDEPFGIITRKDILKVYAEGVDLRETTVDKIANAPLIIVSPGMPIFYAAKIMTKTNLKHLAVFNGQQIVGIISNTDIIKAVVDKKKYISSSPSLY